MCRSARSPGLGLFRLGLAGCVTIAPRGRERLTCPAMYVELESSGFGDGILGQTGICAPF